MTTCPQCERSFPDNLVTEMCVDGDYVLCCPICALRIRNALHGLPANEPFQGPIAKRMHQQAVAHLKRQKT